MNPRILKKLRKRIVELGHPLAKNAWIDNEDSIGADYIGNYLLPEKRKNVPAKRLRSHYMAKTRVSNIYVVGGEPDYCGEACDPQTVYDVAFNHILWTYGKPTKCSMKDEQGHVIDEINGWPEWNGRLTANKVFLRLKQEIEQAAA